MESSKFRTSNSDPSVIPSLTTTFTTLERDLELIEAVKKHEVIYDPRYTRPKDPRTKDLTWNIIGAEISATPDDCRNRWRALRDRFVREKKSLLLGHETITPGRRPKSWQLLDPMSFLWKFIMHRSRRVAAPGEPPWPTPMTDDQLLKLEATEGSHPDMVEDEDEEDEGFEWIAEPEAKRARQESLSPAEDLPVVSSASNVAMSVQSDLHESTQHEDKDSHSILATEDDEDSLFCKSVAHTLRRLAPRRKALAKLRMLQALYDAEFGNEFGPDVEVKLKNQAVS